MDQTFLEILVAKKRNVAAGILKTVSGIMACLFIVMIPFSIICLVLAAAFAALAYYSYLQEWIEYEYSYVCRELTVDKIMARSKRKKEADYLLEKIEVGAAQESWHLDACRNRSCEVRDYSSRGGGNTFVFYYEGSVKVILDKNEELMQALHNDAPSKIFLN